MDDTNNKTGGGTGDNRAESGVDSRHPSQSVIEMAELVGGLAHELRNPLSTMMINLKLLAEELQDRDVHPDDTRRRALLKVDLVRHEAERLQNLFDRFLTLASPSELDVRVIDVNNVVRRLIEFVSPASRSAGLDVQVSLSIDPLLARVDETQLYQALLNIVINAQQASVAGGAIRIESRLDGDQVAIAVEDNGSGIAPEDRDRILRPFYSTKARGSGLGLSITQRIIHEHGGSLSVESEQGAGTTMTIRLPFVQGE